MKITFDQAKRDRVFADRGLAFEDAAVVFVGETITVEDRRVAYGETRYQTVGFLFGRMVMVVWTLRGAVRQLFARTDDLDEKMQCPRKSDLSKAI